MSSHNRSDWQNRCELIHRSGNYSCRAVSQLPNGVRASGASSLPKPHRLQPAVKSFSFACRLQVASYLKKSSCNCFIVRKK